MTALAAPARQERWLVRARTATPPWPPALSLALHGLTLAAALGLLALPRLTPPPPDEGVEMLWDQVPAAESVLAEEVEPASPPPPQAPPPSPALPAPPPPVPLMEAPPAQPDSTALLPPPPPPRETAEAEAPPEEELPLPPPPMPTPPPPRVQPAETPRPPAPQQAQTRAKPSDGAVALTPQPSADGSARVVGATTPPSADYRPPHPAYPRGANERGETGTVRVRLHVDAAGQVTRVEVLESSGSRELDRATDEYYRRWRFRPAQREGQPVAAEVTTAMTWRLNGLAVGRGW